MYKLRKSNLKKLFLALLLFFPATIFAAEKAYIEAVKLDIDEFTTKIYQEQPDSSWLPSSQKASVDGSDSIDSFSQFLNKRFPGSFILYKKLSPKDQNTVWKNYVNTGNLGGIRSDIYSLRRKANRKNRN
jgi:hypothetical protein